MLNPVNTYLLHVAKAVIHAGKVLFINLKGLRRVVMRYIRGSVIKMWNMMPPIPVPTSLPIIFSSIKGSSIRTTDAAIIKQMPTGYTLLLRTK